MDKRYQVFLSSTYSDLINERDKVFQTLMGMDCIPSGMELFPAVDDEQWEFVKKIINDCDYYILVIGGRYGSTTAEGISFTEKEYDYAIVKGLKVLAFLIEDPNAIIVGKTDNDPALAESLSRFREKVQKNRVVKYWKTGSDLPGLVALSLLMTIKTYPAVGWVRATSVGSTELLNEINVLRKENEELRAKVDSQGNHAATLVDNIADMTETVELHGKYKVDSGASWLPWKQEITWNELFALLAPHLLEHPNNVLVNALLRKALLRRAGIENYNANIEDEDFQTIKVQFKAYGLINLLFTPDTKGDMGLFWVLTSRGESTMLKLRAVRKND